MFVTIAICTFNRAESLRRTLNSLTVMQVPTIDLEVIVVNNNCSDHTDATIEAFSKRLPIRREFEKEPGLSNARNRAVDAAKGDYIVWTDDDVIVKPGWLAGYGEAFRRHPEAAVFGGPITPRYQTPVVSWVKEGEPVLGGPYAIRNFGDDPLPLSIADGRLPYGANFAVRTSEQRMFRYDPNLGPGPNTRRGGDEVDLIERMLRTGVFGYWVPTAQVEHYIGHDRQTIQYLVRHFADRGEAEALLQRNHNELRWFGVPRWMLRRLVEEWYRYHIHRLISPPIVWLQHLQGYAYTSGAVRHYWRSVRSG